MIALLAEGPKHGYQLIQEMGARSGGVWTPSPGSIYPILHRLAAAGVVEAEEVEDGRRIFRLTAKGQQAAERLALLGDAPWTTIGDTESDEARQLRQSAVQFDGAITQVTQVATTDQLIRATAMVADSRRRLYALLAEEPAPESAVAPDDDPAS
jgi:DNA-binding PadR family transcriptional regulator